MFTAQFKLNNNRQVSLLDTHGINIPHVPLYKVLGIIGVATLLFFATMLTQSGGEVGGG